MLGASVKLGLVAGLIAGVLAGLFALATAEPSIDEAIRIEEAAAAADHDDGGISRTTQKAGLVVGTGLYGLAIGALFGVAAAWSAGRLRGDAWDRARALGGVAVLAVVLLPAVKYPANPPAVGDPATVGTRTALYLALALAGIVIAGAAWRGLVVLRRWGVREPAAQTAAWAGALAAAAALVLALPDLSGAGAFPADTLWDFRLASVAVQTVLVGGTAVAYGLLATRAPRGERAARRGDVPV